MRRCVTCMVFILKICCVQAQQQEDYFPKNVLESPVSPLGNAYLIKSDSTEEKIKYLIAESEKSLKRRDFLSRLNYLLLALTLEPDAAPNTITTFNLNHQLGNTLVNLHPQYALHFLKKSIAIYERLPEKNQLNKFEIAGAISGIHNRLSERDSVLHWLRVAKNEAFAYHSNIGQASSLNNLGVFFSRVGLRDSAMYYFRNALHTLGNGAPDRILSCSIHDNIAQIRERDGDYTAALRTYRFNDSIYTLLDRPARFLTNRIRLLQTLQKMGKPDLRAEIEYLNRYVSQKRERLSDQDRVVFFKFAKNYCIETGASVPALRYDSLCLAIQDSLDRRNKALTDRIMSAFLQVQTIRFQREAEVYRLESEAAVQALRFSRRMTLALVIAGTIGIGLLVLFMRKRKRAHDLAHRLAVAELQTKELEAQAMAQALEIQKRDITTVALHNTQVLDARRRIVERLTDIVRQKKNTDEALRGFIAELQAAEQLGDRTRLVQENIDRANAEFYQTLSARFPALSKSEVELCGYLRVNLSSKDIASLKNIAPASVKMSKNRLRKKLGISPDADLYTFVQGL